MEKEIINPFIDSGNEVIEELMNEKADIKPVSIVEKMVDVQGMAVVIGFAGKIQGRIIIDVTPEMAHRISEIILQEKIDVQDHELIESSIAEFGNMIAGRSLTKLREMDIEIKITPPTIFKGKNMQILEKDLKMMIVQMKLSMGTIILNISIKNS